MAINFEAANMAGYNNPKIEVLKATMNFTTTEITDAPSKTEIIRCLRRGSIPAILATNPDGSESSLLWIGSRTTDNEGDTIIFANIVYYITYVPWTESPVGGKNGS